MINGKLIYSGVPKILPELLEKGYEAIAIELGVKV